MRKHNTLIFLHIPKAAGTTFNTILQRRYTQDEIYTMDGSTEVFDAFTWLPAQERYKFGLIKGHMPFGVHQYVQQPCSYITLLRNPIHRVISHYYYASRTHIHYLHNKINNDNLTLDEYVGSGLTTEMDNGQTRLLCGDHDEIPFGACSSQMLQQAKDNIERHFAMVGIVESFKEL